MTNAIEFKNAGISELCHEEATDVNGGFFFVALLVNAAVLGTIAAAGAAVVASAEAGYNQACGCN